MALDDWKMRPLQFSGLADALKRCGNIFVRGVMRCVAGRIKPDGSPQKANAASTIKRKGHDHPVVERKGRFQKAGTYKVTPTGDREVMITVANPDNSYIGSELEKKGYDFFGLTQADADLADRVMIAYLDEAVLKAAGARRR